MEGKSYRLNKGFPNYRIHAETAPFYLDAFKDAFSDFKDPNERDLVISSFGYGHGFGNIHLRKEIQKLYGDHFGYSVPPEKMIITHGTRGSLLYLLHQFCQDEKKVIVMEDPTFFCMIESFKQSGYEVVSFAVETFLSDLRKHLEDGNKISALYVIPIFHNPSGVCMNEGKKVELIKLSQKYNFKILSDEVYQFLYFEGNPRNLQCDIKPMIYYDDCKTGGTVFSMSSFSKILSPGLRLGYFMVNERSTLLDGLHSSGWLFTSGACQPILGYIISKMFKNGTFQKRTEEMRNEFKSRNDALCESLSKCKYFTFRKPKGGYFLWLKVEKCEHDDQGKKIKDESAYNIDGEFAKKFKLECEREGVFLQEGNVSSVQNLYPTHFRLSLGFYEKEELKEAGDIMKKVAER